jgi:tetratricopeptide (TPR) repeat protein
MKNLRLLCLALPLILLLGALPGCDERELESPRLRILFTGSVDGYLEPCGCVAGRQGGVDRISAYIEQLRAEPVPSLFVDVGDLFTDELHPGELMAEQLPLKAEALLEVWAQLGCDAKAVGDLDLTIGIEALAELGRKTGVPLLCSNLKHPDTGEYPFERTRIVEVGDLKVGMLSVLGAKLMKADVQEAEVLQVRQEVERQGYALDASNPVIKELAAELRSQVDYVVLLSHAGFDRNLRIAERFPDLDLIVGAHFDKADLPMEWVGNTAVATCVTRGSRVDRIDLWYSDPEVLGDERARIEDWSPWLYYEVLGHVFAHGRQMLAGREAVYGSEMWVDKVRADTVNFNEAMAALQELGAPPAGAAALAHVQVPMYEGLGRREESLQVIDRYHQRLEAHWDAQEQERVHPSKHFAGPDECSKCHPTQYEFWRGTRHSRAYSTLAASHQQFDVECYACHTVGANLVGGFVHPNQAEGFENVQCESCHGPAAWHMKGGASYLEREGWAIEPAAQCATCHNKKHDPDFEQHIPEMLAAVRCPPMPLPGEGSDALRGSFLIGARALTLDAERRWDRIVRAYVFAGEFELAMQAAERWVEEEPRSLDAQLSLGARLVELERYEEARTPLRKVLDRRFNDADAHRLMAMALAAINPERAQMHMKEALSLAPGDPAVVVSVARASAAAGDRLSALDLLRTQMEVSPGLRSQLQPVLDELSGLSSGE